MGLHHTKDMMCTLCESKIKQAHPYLALWWMAIKQRFPDCHISWTFRDKDQQELAKNDGRSRVVWPHSRHNHMKDNRPYARAMDLFKLRDDWVASWDKDYFAQIAAFLSQNSAQIVWGGAWEKFKDAPHFELSKDILD